MSTTRTLTAGALSLVAAGAIGGGFVLAVTHSQTPTRPAVQLHQVADTTTPSSTTTAATAAPSTTTTAAPSPKRG
jgi:hypothetical protein